MTLPTHEDLAKLPHLFQVRYALYAATSVSHLATLPEVAACRRVVEAYLDGKASKEDCRVAATAAYGAYAAAVAASYTVAVAAAAYDAAAVASANAAAHAAGAAADADADAATRAAYYAAAVAAAYAVAAAAYGATAVTAADAAVHAAAHSKQAKATLVADLRRYYEELLNFDAISESYLLG